MRLEDLENKKRALILIRCYLKRGAKRRPRDGERERILIPLDYARLVKRIESGKFEKIGRRRYRLRL